MRLHIIAPLLLAGSLAACATTQLPETTAAPSISLATLTTVTQILSSDEYEGRAPTTAGEDKTVKLIADRFGAAGLQPGNNGSWYQDVPFVETNATPTALTFTGGAQPVRLAYRTDMVANSYQVQPRIDLANSDVVFVGYGINAPERGWNDYAGVNVRGKTVIILVNDPDYEAPAAPCRAASSYL